MAADLHFDGLGVTVGLTCLTVAYVVFLSAYRLWFHPLSKFPGPKLAAVTKWREFYFDIIKRPGAQFFKELNRMHDEYGPIVRLNPDELHVRDSSFFDVLYAGSPAKRDKHPPAAMLVGLPLGTHGTVSHDLHRQRRQAYARMFSKRAITSSQDILQSHIDELAVTLETFHQTGQPFDLNTVLLAYGVDFLYDYMFEIDTGYLRDEKKSDMWRHSMDAVARMTPLAKQFPWLIGMVLKLPRWFRTKCLPSLLPNLAGLLSTHEVMHSAVTRFFEQKDKDALHVLEKGKDTSGDWARPQTLFHCIDQSNSPPQEKSPERLFHEGLTVCLAGGETTSRHLAHIFYQLLEHPDVLAKVRKEIIDASAGSAALPDVSVLEGLPWLKASIREALRLRASTVSRLPLVADRDLLYKNWVVPAGTAISMSHPDILHDGDVFPEPLEFKPERWFNPTEEQNKMFVPFSKGTRMCPGIEITNVFMYMSVAAVVGRFSLELYDTTYERDVKYIKDCFLGEPDPSSKGIRAKVVGDDHTFTKV